MAQTLTDEERFIEAMGRLQQDEQPIVVQMDKTTAFLLLSTIQLAMRHPAFSPLIKKRVLVVAQHLEAAVCGSDSALQEVAARGWEPAADALPVLLTPMVKA